MAHRYLPLELINGRSFIPAALLNALLAPILFTDPISRSLDLRTPELPVAIPALLFAWRTRSLGGTVIAGMLLYRLAGTIC